MLDNGTQVKTTSDDILILCTGYRPNFDFFSQEILEQLSYNSDDVFCPVILHRSIFHPKLPNLAFIGMYRGPFWAIIELQARWVAGIFSGTRLTPSIAAQEIGLDMERRIREQRPRPQYPHSDYVGIVTDLAEEILHATSSNSSDIVLPAQYRAVGPDTEVVNQVNSVCEEANRGRFIAGAVFRALHESQWTFQRTLTGKPSDGVAHGKAQLNYSQGNDLLYREEGKLILASQIPLDVTQKYIYSYDEDNDILSVHFVDKNDRRGSLFHRITFQSKEASNIGWLGHGEHLCSQDQYSTSYLFSFQGITLSRFEITYVVKGPAKDYISKTIFQPENVESNLELKK